MAVEDWLSRDAALEPEPEGQGEKDLIQIVNLEEGEQQETAQQREVRTKVAVPLC